MYVIDVYMLCERKKDANLVIEVLQRVLKLVEKEKGIVPCILNLQLDNCFRENKNKFVFGFVSW